MPQGSNAEVKSVLDWLKDNANEETRAGMARFAIPSDHALGVTVADLRLLAKKLGRNHELALALWPTGIYEARMLSALVDEPERVTSAQMDRQCRGFDNWAICDMFCFALFDRTPHAWAKVRQWHQRTAEFEKRASFALLWALALHDKSKDEDPYHEGLRVIEGAADDERNFVKKAVNMALRAIGKRSAPLNAAAQATAQRLAESEGGAARWIGKHALRELRSESVQQRLARRR